MSPSITVPIQIGLKSRFRLVKTCAATGEVRQDSGWFDNLIVNQGLDQLADSNGSPPAFGGCVVGSGNTPPLPGNTLLESFVAGTGTIQDAIRIENISVAPFYIGTRLTYRFGEGVAAGNLSEVGIVIHNITVPPTAPTGTTPLFSRALILDGGGNPTTITVLSDEFLDVIWEMRTYLPDDAVGNFSLDILGTPTVHSYTIRPSLVTNARVWNFPGSGTSPGGSQRALFANGTSVGDTGGVGSMVSNGTIDNISNNITGSRLLMEVDGTRSTYVNGDYFLDLTFNYGLNQGNANPSITAIAFGCGAVYFQMSISPGVAKTNQRVFSIVLRVSWANRP